MKPLLVHLSAHRLSPRSHPAIWRQVIGLAERYRQVFLELDEVGYVNDGLRSDEREELARLEIATHRVDRKPLLRLERAAWVAAGLRRRYGSPAAFVGQLGGSGWRALPLAAPLDAPVFTLFYGSDARVDMAKPRMRPRFEALARAPGARFGGVARNIVEDLVAWGLPREHVSVQHSGVDVERWAVPEREATAGALRIAMVGRFVPFKGQVVALRAFAIHLRRFPESRLHLYGSGPCEPEARKLAEELAIGHAVVFHGLLPIERVEEELARADVLLQTSVTDAEGYAEGLPNTILEGMASGLPVIASRHGGIPHAVIPGETGFLLPEGEVGGVADALARLAEAPLLRRRLGDAGRSLVEERFDARDQARRFADRLDGMGRDYRVLPPPVRRKTWRDALTRLVGPDRRGPGARLRGVRAAWMNRWIGRIG